MGSADSTSAYIVRRFESRDATAIETITKSSPEAAQWSQESYAKLCEQGGLVWVAEAAGTIAGFMAARVISQEVEILNLAVAPAHRRAGIAAALLQHAFPEFHRLHATQVFAEVRESNATALRFYEKHNFVRTGRRPSYYQNPMEAAVLLMRKLTA
jgi:[ribosomal protein S18]-alanine N-acetyltransferase